MAMRLRWFLVLILAYIVIAVDKNNFKSCDQSSFCRRLRNVKPNESKYELNLDSLQVSENSVESDLVNTEANVLFKFTLTAIKGNIFRVFVVEKEPLFKRFQPQFSLKSEPELEKLEVLDRNKDSITVKSGDNKVIVTAKPIKLEFFKNDVLVSVVNSRGLFTYEHYRPKSPAAEGEGELEVKEDPGAWEENFKSHHDSKPRGPEAIGADFSFPEAYHVYGIPEHADKLALRTTGLGGLDPYRLYNLDVFEYELDSQMALYGSVPVLYSNGPKGSVGIFWNSVAETWVDVDNSKDRNVVSSIVNLVSGSSEQKVDVHFMSESGAIDFFVLMGPTIKDAVKQYASLTGVAPLPPYFSLGYHQCRWNYNDEDDVTGVIEKMDIHDFQVDVIWLDIEYTDGKKYFTWDQNKFPHPDVMVNNLTATGRKLVVIIDPHIKRESGYFLHEDALANDYYVKNKDGNVYEGWCWPGSSGYLDLYKQSVRDYYKGLYPKFKGTNDDVHIWNDMNEPSVFNGPEVTMLKDCLHEGGFEHRHVHNEYGLAYTSLTFEGLLERNSNRRPFILTRAHSSGSQRTAAVWTGDNAADWGHLKASFPMCLSEALAGISFCGADIGGFFNNPDEELLQRWYQAGVWLPFFRAHAHIDTRRREPYLFTEDVRNRIRNAIRLRYSLLPLFYTLFWEHEITGEPVIRPLFYHYPEEKDVADIEDELLVGNSILAHPVTDPGASTVSVYFPGGSEELWYDIEDFKKYPGTGKYSLPVTLDKIPAFYRGGSIVARKDRPRRASTLMHDDPFTLYIALDNKQTASGTLYVDDSESYDYKNKQKYLYMHYEFNDNTLFSKSIDKTDFFTKEWIEKVVILGAQKKYKGAQLISKSLGSVDLEVSYDGEYRALVIRKPGINVKEHFAIKLL